MKYLFLILFIVGCGSDPVAFSIDHKIVDWCKINKAFLSCVEADDRNKCEDEIRSNPSLTSIAQAIAQANGFLEEDFISHQYCIDNELDKLTGQSCQSIQSIMAKLNNICPLRLPVPPDILNNNSEVPTEVPCISLDESMERIYNLLKCDKLLNLYTTINK